MYNDKDNVFTITRHFRKLLLTFYVFVYSTADEAEAYYVLHMFFFLGGGCFFRPSQKNTRQPFSGTAERIFMKLLPNDSGESVVSNFVQPPGEWRMLICVIYAMTLLLDMGIPTQRYAMTLAESPEGATHGGCVIKPIACEWI